MNFLSRFIRVDDLAIDYPFKSPQIYLFAFLAIHIFDELQPNIIFCQLRLVIDKLCAHHQNWIQVHTALSLIRALLNESIPEFVGIYVLHFFDSILNYCTMDQPAKLREIAFQILLLLLDNYPRGITNDNLDTQRLDSILQLFEQLLSSITLATQLSRDDLNLFRIGSSIISRIGKMSSTFTIYFDRCFNISRRFFEIGRSRGFKVLIAESSETITQLAIGLPKSLIDKLPALYEEIFTEFENLSNDHIENDLFSFSKLNIVP